MSTTGLESAPRGALLPALGVTALLVLAVQAWMALERSLTQGVARPELLVEPSQMLVHASLGLALLLAVRAADRAVDRGRAPRQAYGWAIVAGCAGGAVLQFGLLHLLQVPDAVRGAAPQVPGPLQPALVMLEYVLWAAVFVAPYAGLRARSLARERAASLQRRGLLLQEDAARARAALLQSRLDLPWLLAALARVRAVAARDAAQGARLIDALSACLRAALPPRRGAAPVSLQDEVDLTVAWLELASGHDAAARAPALVLSATPEALARPVPSPLLLPLIERLFERGAGTAAAPLVLQAECRGEALHLDLAGAAATPAPDAHAMGDLADRLQALAGGAPTLCVDRPEPGRCHVRLQLPAHRPTR